MSAPLARRALAVLGLLALGLVGAARAQDSVVVRVGGDLAGRVGDYIDVPVSVDLSAAPGRKLGGFRLQLIIPRPTQCGDLCPPEYLSFSEIRPGNFGSPQAQVSSSPTADTIKAAGLLPAGASGVVQLFTVRFYVAIDTVTVPITLVVSELTAAQSSSTPFEDLTPLVRTVSGQFCRSQGKWGDVDGDGASGSRDALVALSYVVGLPVDTAMRPLLADVDGDARVTSRDALIMLSYAVGLPVPGQRVLLTAAGACGTGSATTLALSADTLTLVPDQEARVAVAARDAIGRTVPTTGLVWRIANGDVAGWSEYSGFVGRSVGTTTATAELGPGVQARLVVRVLQRRPNWYVDVRRATNAVTQDGSQRYPMEFIGDAVYPAQDGDTVRVAGGVYEETISGTRNLAIIGDSLDRPIIDMRSLGGESSGWVMQLGSVTGDLTVLHLVFRGGGVKSLAYNTTLRNLRFENQAGWPGAVQVESGVNPNAPFAPYPASLGNATISDLVLVDIGGQGIVVGAVDTVIVHHSTISAAATQYGCEGDQPGIVVSAPNGVSFARIHDNVLSQMPCTGISVWATGARVLLERNRIGLRGGSGIEASARWLTSTHNVVSMRPLSSYSTMYGLNFASAFPADSVRSVGDSVAAPVVLYSTGLRMDSVVQAGIVDSLMADSIGIDSGTSQYGTAVSLGRGRYTVSNSRIRFAGREGISFSGAAGSSLVSRRNRFLKSGRVALTAQGYYGSAGIDSVVSVSDTILGSGFGGVEVYNARRARVDSALVDSAGNFDAAGVNFEVISRGSVTHSTIQRTYVGLRTGTDTLLVSRSTIHLDSTAILLFTPAGPAPDSARIYGTHLDSNRWTGLEIHGAVFAVDSSTMVGNLNSGLYVDGVSGGRVTRSRLTGNVHGVRRAYPSSGDLILANNNIQGNSYAGVANEDGGNILDARNNYWGSTLGPSCDILVTGVACDPAGGDSVKTAYVLFTPFLNDAVTVTPSAPAGLSALPVSGAALVSRSTSRGTVWSGRRSEQQLIAPRVRSALRAEPTKRPLPPSQRRGHPPRPPAGMEPQP